MLTSDERIFIVKDAAPVFDDETYPWSEVEGYYLIAPGNVLKYLKWKVDERSREENTEND